MEQEEIINLDDTAPEEIDPETWEKWKQWDMLPSNDFIYQVQRGKLGLNVGLYPGLNGLNKYTYGTHMARYYLIGADSSVGKSTFADFVFVFNAIQSAKAKGKPIKIFYCSFEMAKLDKVARWVSFYVHMRFGEAIPSDYILGRIEGVRLSDKHEWMVKVGYQMVLDLMKDIYFFEDVIHPTAIFEGMIENHYEKNGRVTRTEVSDEDRKKGKKGYVTGYYPNDPNLITMLIVDHLALAGSEQKLDTKGVMDRMSKYGIVLRNLFHCTICYIQQFSTDLMSFHRTNRKAPESIAPQRLDFGDSKATFRDADVVIGLVNPLAYDFDKFLGYQLSGFGGEELGHCFRMVYLMKNRYGPSGRALPMFLDGITGKLYDLPPEPHNILAMQKWYDKANQIEKLCQTFSPSQLIG